VISQLASMTTCSQTMSDDFVAYVLAIISRKNTTISAVNYLIATHALRYNASCTCNTTLEARFIHSRENSL